MIAVVTGGSGFLGRELVRELLLQDDYYDCVVVVDTKPFEYFNDDDDDDDGDGDDDDDDNNKKDYNSRIRWIEADVRNISALKSAFTGASVVFHLASVVHVGLSPHPLIEEVNVFGTRNVIEVCQCTPSVRALVYTSTCDVVFDGEPKVYTDESTPYPSVPCSDYVRTKITAEKMVRQAATSSKLRTCCLRPTHQYGPRDPHAILQALKSFRWFPVRFGTGDALFDVVYIGNVAHAHALAAKQLLLDNDDDDEVTINGQCYFINENNYCNFFEFMRPYATAMGVSVPWLPLPYVCVWLLAMLVHVIHAVFPRYFDPDFNVHVVWLVCKHFFFSSERARCELGYTPKYTRQHGVDATIRWLHHHHHQQQQQQ